MILGRERIAIASYYKQLSVDGKILRFIPVLLDPRGRSPGPTKLKLIYDFIIYYSWNIVYKM